MWYLLPLQVSLYLLGLLVHTAAQFLTFLQLAPLYFFSLQKLNFSFLDAYV